MPTGCSSSTISIGERRQRLAARGRGRSDAAQFKPFADRVRQFIEFRKELARLGVEVGQAAGREWGDNDANRTVRRR